MLKVTSRPRVVIKWPSLTFEKANAIADDESVALVAKKWDYTESCSLHPHSAHLIPLRRGFSEGQGLEMVYIAGLACDNLVQVDAPIALRPRPGGG